MTVTRIHDLDDPRLEVFRNLKATNATRYSDHLIAEGAKLVWRLIEHNYRLRALLATQRYAEEFAPAVPADLPIWVVSDRDIETIVGFNFHQGVLACAGRPTPADLDALCQSTDRLTLVVCPEIHDPENLGSILRISAAFGVNGILLGRDCCDPFSRRALRVSMASGLGLPNARPMDLAAELDRLRQSYNLTCWASVTAAGAAPFDRVERPERLALLLGSEGHGLPDFWREFCDLEITIPMQTGIDSLNVAVAAGILLYQLGGRTSG